MHPLWNEWPPTGPMRKEQGHIAAGSWNIPAWMLSGAAPGKSVLVTAGVHGCEYPGIVAVMELAAELDPAKMNGNVLFLAPVNISGFRDRLSELAAEDGKNLNRLFPGDPGGSPSEKVAAALTSLHVRADFYLDLHSGDLHENLRPFVFFPGIAEAGVVEASRAAATVLDMDIRVRSGASTGAYNSAAIKGVPSLLIERGGLGVWTRPEVEAYKTDIRAVLAHLGVLPAGEGNPLPRPQREITSATYLEADRAGCWFPAVHAGRRVRRGETLGEIRNFFGNVLAEYRAERDGEVLYLTVSLSVAANTPLVAYG